MRVDPADRLYTLEEIVLFLDGLGCLPSEVGEGNEEAVRDWIEHMEAGEIEIGQPKEVVA